MVKSEKKAIEKTSFKKSEVLSLGMKRLRGHMAGIFKYSKEKKILYSIRNNWCDYKQADGSPTV